MTSKIPGTLIRIDPELKKKLVYIADFEVRTLNKQIWYILKNYVLNFERKNGKIPLDE